jgi:hypothetical protein
MNITILRADGREEVWPVVARAACLLELRELIGARNVLGIALADHRTMFVADPPIGAQPVNARATALYWETVGAATPAIKGDVGLIRIAELLES